MKQKDRKHTGQALVTLLFFVIIGISITTAGAIMLLTNAFSTSNVDQGTSAYYAAEGGIENALLLLLRNPNYTGGTVPVGEGSAAVVITQGNPLTIVSTGTYANAVRKIQVKAVYNNSALTVSSWKEIQ